METVLVLLIVVAATGYAAQALLPRRWLPRWLRRAGSAADGCSGCASSSAPDPPDTPPRPGS